MLPHSPLPVVALTGMTFEARIASGPDITVVCSCRADVLAEGLAAAIAKGCRGIVSFGIAGGLAPHLRPGACIIARSIVTPQQERIDTHLEWASQLLQTISGSTHADLLGSRELVSLPSDKIALRRSTGAVAVDMESIIGIRAAAEHGLPFAAVRVVADACHRELPPAAQIQLTVSGSPDLPAVLRSVMGRPRQVSALMRVALDTRTARSALLRARRELGFGFGLLDVAAPLVAQRAAAALAE